MSTQSWLGQNGRACIIAFYHRKIGSANLIPGPSHPSFTNQLFSPSLPSFFLSPSSSYQASRFLGFLFTFSLIKFTLFIVEFPFEDKSNKLRAGPEGPKFSCDSCLYVSRWRWRFVELGAFIKISPAVQKAQRFIPSLLHWIIKQLINSKRQGNF